MTLASIFNVPSTPQEWDTWAFAHMDHHRQIIQAVSAQKQTKLSEYILDPIPFESISGWAQNHQQMHTDMDSTLGIGGFDLTELDVETPGAVAAWVRIHAVEHRNAALALGID